MTRIPPVPREEADEQLLRTYEYLEQKYGKNLEPVGVMARNREILAANLSFEKHLQAAHTLDHKLRELAILRTATLVGCAFCLDLGSADSLKAGITPAQVQSINEYRTSEHFSETERLVLEFADAMTNTPGRVPDELFLRVRKAFDDAQIVELTGCIAWENFRSRFNRALGMTSHGFTEKTLCALPANG